VTFRIAPSGAMTHGNIIPTRQLKDLDQS
jgi:hypothetical protein